MTLNDLEWLTKSVVYEQAVPVLAYAQGDEVGARYGEIEYRGGNTLQLWHVLGGNIHLSHLLMSFLLLLLLLLLLL